MVHHGLALAAALGVCASSHAQTPPQQTPPDAAPEARVSGEPSNTSETTSDSTAAPPADNTPAAPVPATGDTTPAPTPETSATPSPTDAQSPTAAGTGSSTDPAATGSAPARDAGPLPLALIAGGGSAALGGTILFVVGQSRRNKIEGAAVGTAWRDVQQYEDADIFTGLGAVLMVGGLITGVAGVILAASRPRTDAPESAGEAPALQFGPNGVQLRGTL